MLSRRSQVIRNSSPNRSSRSSKPSCKVSNTNITFRRERRTIKGNQVALFSFPIYLILREKKNNFHNTQVFVLNNSKVNCLLMFLTIKPEIMRGASGSQVVPPLLPSHQAGLEPYNCL